MSEETTRPRTGPVPRRPKSANPGVRGVRIAAPTGPAKTTLPDRGVVSSGAYDTPDPTHPVFAIRSGHESTEPSLEDWTTWLDLSATPAVTSRAAATIRFHLDGGRILDPDSWPADSASRVYVVYDDAGVVYVGQTSLPLPVRIRSHFSNQRTRDQQHKAGTWRVLVNAAFPGLRPGELDALERSAAEWLLPLRHRTGRRHPKYRPP